MLDYWIDFACCVGGTVTDAVKRAKRPALFATCYAAEVARGGVRVAADVASRVTISVSHGPVSVTLAPKQTNG